MSRDAQLHAIPTSHMHICEQGDEIDHGVNSASSISRDPNVVPANVDQNEKSKEINRACGMKDVRELARLSTTHGGFLNDALRFRVWPILLGVDICTNDNSHTSHGIQGGSDTDEHVKHKDEDQVMLDVNRSFVYYPANQSVEKIESMKYQLAEVIISTLRRYPKLCYFQGYHDIIQVLLLVLGPGYSAAAAPYISLLRIRDFMLPSLAPSLDHLQLLPAIIQCVDPKLCRHLSQTRPFFALASTLTLYAHDIQDYGVIARLFDFLLAHEPSVSIYLYAVIILSRDNELFEIEPDDPEMLHFTLSKLPKSLELESLISRTLQIFYEHPPELLPFGAWGKVARYSVLKTSRRPRNKGHGIPNLQTLAEGEKLLQWQAVDLRRAELRRQVAQHLWRYRRPVGSVALAILIGALSIWLQKQNQGGYTVPLSKLWNQMRTILRV